MDYVQNVSVKRLDKNMKVLLVNALLAMSKD